MQIYLPQPFISLKKSKKKKEKSSDSQRTAFEKDQKGEEKKLISYLQS